VRIRIRDLAGWGLVALLVGTGAGVVAEDRVVRARIEPGGRITDSQTIRLVVEVEGEDFSEISVPHLPAMRNLKVVSGPNTSQSSVFHFDGTRSRQVMTSQLIYGLIAEGPGPAEIPAIEVRIGTDTRRTDPIRFEIERGATGRPSSPGATPEADVPVFLLNVPSTWQGGAAAGLFGDELARLVDGVGADRVVWGSDAIFLSITQQLGKVIGSCLPARNATRAEWRPAACAPPTPCAGTFSAAL